jgi:hypothetical protein
LNKAIFHLILFTLVLNLSTGLMTVLVVDVAGNPIFTQQDRALVPVYDANGTQFFTDASGGTINPGASATDAGNLVFRLLDLIGLGFINKLISIVNNYMYGFINLLNSLFGPWLATNTALYSLLFGVNWYVTPGTYLPIAGMLKTIITIGYVLAAIELWTNKSITD